MLDLKVHHFEKIKGTQQWELTKVVPYVRVKAGASEPPLFIQGGRVYSEGGQLIENLPSWFDAEVAKVNPQMLRACGWLNDGGEEPEPEAVTVSMTDEEILAKAREIQAQRAEEVKVEAPIAQPATEGMPLKMWTCDECQEEVNIKAKGFHIARHRKMRT